MNIGAWIPSCRHQPAPATIQGTAVRAEQLAWDSVRDSDHVVEPHATNFGTSLEAQTLHI